MPNAARKVHSAKSKKHSSANLSIVHLGALIRPNVQQSAVQCVVVSRQERKKETGVRPTARDRLHIIQKCHTH